MNTNKDIIILGILIIIFIFATVCSYYFRHHVVHNEDYISDFKKQDIQINGEDNIGYIFYKANMLSSETNHKFNISSFLLSSGMKYEDYNTNDIFTFHLIFGLVSPYGKDIDHSFASFSIKTPLKIHYLKTIPNYEKNFVVNDSIGNKTSEILLISENDLETILKIINKENNKHVDVKNILLESNKL